MLTIALVMLLIPAAAFAEGAEGSGTLEDTGTVVDTATEGAGDNDTNAEPAPVTTKFAHQYDANLYTPETSLVDTPEAVWDARTATQHALLKNCTADVRPQVVEVNVRLEGTQLGVAARDGLLDLREFVEAIEQTALPALFVSDEATADALIEFSNTYGLHDAFVVANVSLVKRVVSATTGIRGVVDFTSRSSMSSASLAAVPGKVYTAGARSALFEADALTAQQVSYLRNRFLCVWLNSTTSTTRTDMLETVEKGADGVVASDFAGFYETLATFDDENALMAMPRITGHRGSAGAAKKNRSGYAENTIKAYRWAVKQGAPAIETDVWLVDGKLVIKHTKPNHANELLTLKEVLAAFQDTDVVIHVDLKSGASWSAGYEATYAIQCVSKIAALLKSYPNAKDNVVFASFYSSMIKAVRDKMPWAPRSFITTFGNSNSHDRYTRSVERNTAYNLLEEWCCVYGPSYKRSTETGVFGKSFSEGLRARCVSTGYWVANDDKLDALIVNNCTNVTTDTADRVSGYSANVQLTNAAKETVYVGCNEQGNTVENLDLESLVTVKTQQGGVVADPELHLTCADGTIVAREDGTYAFADPNKLEAQVLIACTQVMKNGTAYTVYSDPVTLKGIPVNDADNGVTVTWKDSTGAELDQQRYYVAYDAMGNALMRPTPDYKRANLVPAPTAHVHYKLVGWQDLNGDVWDLDELEPLTIKDVGKSLEYTVVVKEEAHKADAAATCLHAQTCTVCGASLHEKIGHTYKAGICTMCGHVKKASKVKQKKLKAKKHKVVVRWKKKSGSEGYRIKYRKKGTTAWTYKTVSNSQTKKTISKLKSKKRYQFRVQNYVVVDEARVYGKWSAFRTIKVK